MSPAGEVDAILRRFGLASTGAPEPVPESLLNRNYRVDTASGTFFVRIHRSNGDLARLELEAAAMEHCAARGIPVPLPLRDREGERFALLDGRYTSMYPWVEGRIFASQLTPAEAAVLGDIEGRLQAALLEFPPALAANLSAVSMGAVWDTGVSRQALRDVLAVIAEREERGESLGTARELAHRQLSLLEREAVSAQLPEFTGITRQPVFGDFHYRNVMVDGPGEHVVAVVDWEMVTILPPLYELLRAVQFCGLGAREIEEWARAYGRHVPAIPAAECRAAVAQRWQATLHGTWALRTVFLDGDAGPSRFFEEEVETLTRWSDPAYRDWLADTLARHVGR